jgi:ABC-type sugar transport system substrate-binding protein
MPARRHVVLLLPDSTNPYMQLSAEAASRAADRLGVSLDIQFAEREFTTQVRQIYSAIRGIPRPSIVMVTPVQESALRTLSEQTVDSGIGWFWLSRSVGNEKELRARHPQLPICMITPDQREAGRIQARQVKALLERGGRLLYVQGRMTNQSARLRAEAFRETLARGGSGLELIGELDGNWSPDAAKQALDRWMQVMKPTRLRPDAVVCQSDAMATGILAGLKALAEATGEPALARIPVLGADGLRAIGRHMVDAGQLAATILLPITTERALQAAAAFFDNGELPPAEITLEPVPYPEEAVMVRRWRRTA